MKLHFTNIFNGIEIEFNQIQLIYYTLTDSIPFGVELTSQEEHLFRILIADKQLALK